MVMVMDFGLGRFRASRFPIPLFGFGGQPYVRNTAFEVRWGNLSLGIESGSQYFSISCLRNLRDKLSREGRYRASRAA